MRLYTSTSKLILNFLGKMPLLWRFYGRKRLHSITLFALISSISFHKIINGAFHTIHMDHFIYIQPMMYLRFTHVDAKLLRLTPLDTVWRRYPNNFQGFYVHAKCRMYHIYCAWAFIVLKVSFMYVGLEIIPKSTNGAVGEIVCLP